VLSDTQSLTALGQIFNFSFSGVPTTGTLGQFSITLNGDYSGNLTETATATVDVAAGAVLLGNFALPNGITFNTIGGLSLLSHTLTTFSANDTEQTWMFSLTDLLLASILADGVLTATVRNSAGINVFGESNPDFVRVEFSFDPAAVPEPGAVALFVLGIAGCAGSRRLKRHNGIPPTRP
jgi:hypothetical protein